MMKTLGQITDQESLDAIAALYRGEIVHLKILAGDLFSLIALLQLAWRHPQLNKRQKAIAEKLVRAMEPMLVSISPRISEVIERGWDVKQDVTME